jgi:enoyl-[acyl-carrier protein] reductase I
MTHLAGKRGLVLGIANRRSISWAIAEAAAASGARLVLTYQGERLAGNVAELAAGLPNEPLILPCDVTSDQEIEELFRQVRDAFGSIDFLVHGAAYAPREELARSFLDTTREGFRITLDVSTYSLIALARGAAPLMPAGGSILTLSYLGSMRVFPNYNVMGVAKAALEATVRYLAGALGPKHIRVNAVSAGPIRTVASSGIPGFTNVLQLYRERSALGRTIEASEVASAAVFLLGDAASAVTGEVLMVDAGFHIIGM